MHRYGKAPFRAAIALLVAAALLLPVITFAPAEPVQDKKQQLEQIKSEVQAIDSRMDIVVEQYNSAMMRVEENQAAIRRNEAEIASMQETIRERQAILGARLRAMYINGSTDVLEVLTDCKSVDDFISNMSLARRISDGDVDIIRSVSTARDELNAANQKLAALQNELAASLSEVASQKASIEAELARRRSLLAGVEAEVNALMAQDEAARTPQARPATGRDPNYVPPQPNPNAPEVVKVAYAQLGKPYRYGATGPDEFDCAGLTQYCYFHVGMSIGRTTWAQAKCGDPVDYADLQPGDLVFFHGYGHVGMYIGDGNYLHAPHTGDVVRIADLGRRRDFCGARRPR